jgi:hypothetical protein
MKAQLREPIELLRAWDRRWAVDSIATALAVFWGEDVQRRAPAEQLLQSHSGWIHLSRVGISGLIRRETLSGHKKNGTAPAETASSPWLSSASACAQWP